MEPTSVLTPHTQAKPPRGFTLVEMVVVLAIIGLITAIAVTGQSTYNKTLILTDTTYSVAFSARQAQSYGIASRKYAAITTNPGYGLHFDRATPTSYIFFADIVNTLSPFPTGCPVGTPGTPSAKPGNCRFDVADGKVNTYSFSRGFSIKQFCGKVSNTTTCSTDATPLTTLDVVFARPNTSTTISGLVNSVPVTFTCATLTITDQTGQGTRMVRFSSLGEITVGVTLACP